MKREVEKLTQGKAVPTKKTIMLTEEEAAHLIDLLEFHSSSLTTTEFRMFSKSQKENIRAFDGAIIEKLR